MTSSAILIPARYASTRFPGKPLAMLDGVSMIRRVFRTCVDSGFDTYVLTDDERIYDEIGPHCYIDDEEYDNGTERCGGAVNKWDKLDNYDQFINVQGDMPDVTKQMIERCVEWLKQH